MGLLGFINKFKLPHRLGPRKSIRKNKDHKRDREEGQFDQETEDTTADERLSTIATDTQSACLAFENNDLAYTLIVLRIGNLIKVISNTLTMDNEQQQPSLEQPAAAQHANPGHSITRRKRSPLKLTIPNRSITPPPRSPTRVSPGTKKPTTPTQPGRKDPVSPGRHSPERRPQDRERPKDQTAGVSTSGQQTNQSTPMAESVNLDPEIDCSPKALAKMNNNQLNRVRVQVLCVIAESLQELARTLRTQPLNVHNNFAPPRSTLFY